MCSAASSETSTGIVGRTIMRTSAFMNGINQDLIVADWPGLFQRTSRNRARSGSADPADGTVSLPIHQPQVILRRVQVAQNLVAGPIQFARLGAAISDKRVQTLLR